MWMSLAEEFAQAGHDVCVFAREFEGQARREVRNGVLYDRFSGFAQSRQIAVDLVKDLIYALRAAPRLRNADILVTNDFWLPAICAAIRTTAGKIVVNANRFPKGQYVLYGGASAIVAASSSVRNAIVRERPALADRTVVIPNIVHPAFLEGGEAKPRVSGARTLLYIGRLHPEKGVSLLVQAFAALGDYHRNWRLRILGPHLESAGGGGEEHLRQLRRMAGTAPIDFCEPIYGAEALAAVYRNAELFCYPSLADRGEACPVAPLEAMACGLPVVTSAIECFSDIVTEGETGWSFEHRSADARTALGELLARAMSDPSRLKAMGAKAQTLAASYRAERIARRYIDIFSTLIAQHKARA